MSRRYQYVAVSLAFAKWELNTSYLNSRRHEIVHATEVKDDKENVSSAKNCNEPVTHSSGRVSHLNTRCREFRVRDNEAPQPVEYNTLAIVDKTKAMGSLLNPSPVDSPMTPTRTGRRT